MPASVLIALIILSRSPPDRPFVFNAISSIYSFVKTFFVDLINCLKPNRRVEIDQVKMTREVKK